MDLGLTDPHMKQSRWWFGTWKNPAEGEDPPSLGLKYNHKIKYVTGQKERAANGTVHFQLLVYLTRDQRLSYMKDIHGAIHWEPVKNLPKAYEYVHKESSRVDTSEDFGEMPKALTARYTGHGGRVKTEPLKVIQLVNKSFAELAEELTASSYNSAIKAKRHYENQIQPPFIPTKDMPCRGMVYYGATHAGKSTGVRLKYQNIPYYLKQPNQWWNGYNRQKIVILEDLQPSHMSAKTNNGCDLTYYLKIWGDYIPFDAEQKLDSFPIQSVNPTKFILTTQYTWEELLAERKNDKPLLDALRRRFPVTYVCPDNREELFGVLSPHHLPAASLNDDEEKKAYQSSEKRDFLADARLMEEVMDIIADEEDEELQQHPQNPEPKQLQKHQEQQLEQLQTQPVAERLLQERTEADDGEEEDDVALVNSRFLAKFTYQHEQQIRGAIMKALYEGFPSHKTIQVDELLAKVQADYEALDIATFIGFIRVFDAENRLIFAHEKKLIYKI